MCGIAGFWKQENREENLQTSLECMLALLHHRGPDGFGTYTDSQNGLAMGHARLSIIDLSGGHQPLYSQDKNLVLTVNGEFYAYQAIRANFLTQGQSFQTKSDSEIALPLYKKYGLDFVKYLRGEFAFALLDKKKRRLILVRDRFGIRPLFYHLSPQGFFYASEIKGLMAHREVPRKLSPQSVMHQLMHTMVPGTTAFEAIHAVKPGHFLVVEEEGGRFKVQQHRYWDIDFPRIQDYESNLPPEHFVDGVREQLIESVQLRLKADVPVGCYLSGGIDSCSILGLATALQQSPVKAYTISFDHKDYDESSIARQMAERTQAEQEVLSLKATDLYGESYLQTLWHAERSFYNTLGVAKWWMSRKVHESGYKVVITGEGSDELFSGYPAFKLDMALHDPEGFGAENLDVLKKNNLFVGSILSETQVTHPAFEKLCGMTPSWIQPWILTLKLAREILAPEFLEQVQNYDPLTAIVESMDSKQLEGRHPVDKAQYTWIKTMLECQILSWGGDRVDMAHSMESRPAFLDHYVAESAVKIPPTIRIKNGIEKWVLREAMRGILPEVLYQREKFAFMAPPAHTDTKKIDCLKVLIQDHLTSEALKSSQVFDEERLRLFIQDYFSDTASSMQARRDALMNHILGVQLLHEKFVEQDLVALSRQKREQYFKAA